MGWTPLTDTTDKKTNERTDGRTDERPFHDCTPPRTLRSTDKLYCQYLSWRWRYQQKPSALALLQSGTHCHYLTVARLSSPTHSDEACWRLNCSTSHTLNTLDYSPPSCASESLATYWLRRSLEIRRSIYKNLKFFLSCPHNFVVSLS